MDALERSGKTSRNPLQERFVTPENRRYVLIALFGAAAGRWWSGTPGNSMY